MRRNAAPRSSHARHLLVAAGAIALLLAAQAGAQPGGHLTITNVGVNFNDHTIEIIGEQLDFGPGPLVVSLGGEDITAGCTLNSPTDIDCDLSDLGGIPANGDYLLVVSNGHGQSQNDEYDLSIQRVFFPNAGLVYTNTASKGNANVGEAVANNKFVDATCDSGDILLSCGIVIAGSTGNGSVTAATLQEIADHVNIVENRMLGGASACRARAVETPVNGLENHGWQIRSIAECLDITP
jgi:hypothetical protein